MTLPRYGTDDPCIKLCVRVELTLAFLAPKASDTCSYTVYNLNFSSMAGGGWLWVRGPQSCAECKTCCEFCQTRFHSWPFHGEIHTAMLLWNLVEHLLRIMWGSWLLKYKELPIWLSTPLLTSLNGLLLCLEWQFEFFTVMFWPTMFYKGEG